ncbi:MAG: hypothetical protein AAF355_12100 [Myxococcota bacterium]
MKAVSLVTLARSCRYAARLVALPFKGASGSDLRTTPALEGGRRLRGMLAGALFVWLLQAVCFHSAAEAQSDVPKHPPEPSTYETSRGLAMGSGARAGATGSSAVAYNPASLTAARVYHIESNAQYFPDSDLWSIGGSAVDSITNSMAAGIAARGILGGEDGTYTGYDLRLALGLPVSNSIGLGVSGRYIRLRGDPQGDDVEDQGLKRLTLDASVQVNPTENIHLAVLGYNLIRTDSSLAPQQVGGALAIDAGGVFTLASDLLVDLTTFDSARVLTGGGLEFLLGSSIPFRVGYRFDSGRDLHSVTGGLGYVDQAFGVDFSLRQDVTQESETQLLVSIRYHVQ